MALKVTPLQVEGMMCQRNCAATVQRALLAVAGVQEVVVTFATGSAVVSHAADVSGRLLLDAVEGVGFDCTFLENTEPLYRLEVTGMMCEKNCVATVRAALRALPGVSWSLVSLSTKEARVWGAETLDARAVLACIDAVGFDARLKTHKGRYTTSVPAPAAAVAVAVEGAGSGAGKEERSRVKRAAAAPLAAPSGKGPQTAEAEAGTQVELRVGGMSCAACVQAVERGLGALPGVRSVRVALLSERALVMLAPASAAASAHSTDGAALAACLEGMGYSAGVLGETALGLLRRGVVRVDITGMSCAACAAAIEAALLRLQGVSSASVSVATGGGQAELDEHSEGAAGARDVVEAVRALGYGCRLSKGDGGGDGGGSGELAAWGRLLAAALLLGLPVMALHVSSGISASVRAAAMRPALCGGGVTLGQTVMLLLNFPLQFGVGYRFYRGALLGVLHGNYGMDLLVATGTSVSFLYSSWQLALACGHGRPTTHVFFETSGMLLMFVTLGKYMEAYSRGQSTASMRSLLALQPARALLVHEAGAKGGEEVKEGKGGGDELDGLCHDRAGAPSSSGSSGSGESERVTEIDVGLVQRGDLLKVLPGARIPTDGRVHSGSSHVDEALITGESVAKQRGPGDIVFGSTVNQHGLLYVRASSIGADSALAQIVRLVEQAQMSKAPVQKYADRIAAVFTPVVLCLALATFGTWALLAYFHQIPREWFADEYGDPVLFSLLFAISVVVISCPCALGLATPTAIMVGTSVGASNGILIKGGAAFEAAHSIDTVIFDKTGTLTTGRPVLTDILVNPHPQPQRNHSSDSDTAPNPNPALPPPATEAEEATRRLLLLAATAEQASEHPLSSALLLAARQSGLALPRLPPASFRSVPGRGVECDFGGETVRVGNRALMADCGASLGPLLEASMLAWEGQGKTCLCVAVGARLEGVLAVADQPKAEARSAVLTLRGMGVDVWMVTGDNAATAAAIAALVDIPSDRVVAGALPADKVSRVSALKQRGRSVCVVGDGVNDSPALARADLGIAIGAGTQVAMEAADLVLVRSDLRDVVVALDLAKVVFRRIQLNFVWALAYNVVAIPLAAGCWFPWTHMLVPPQYAGLCMALSSISVVASSAALRLYARPKMQETDSLPSSSSPLSHLLSLTRVGGMAGAGGQEGYSRLGQSDELSLHAGSADSEDGGGGYDADVGGGGGLVMSPLSGHVLV